jgi:hypothetical protein
MTVFRIISCLCILAMVGAIAFDLRNRHADWKGVTRFLRSRWDASVDIWNQRKGVRTDPGLSIVRRIVYLVTLGLALILAVTAFAPVLFLGEHVSGVLLVIHVTVAPVFSVALAILALLWAHRLRFRAGDWRVPQKLIRGKMPEQSPLVRFMIKGGFWLVLFCALPLLLSIILSMYPWFGTEGQECLRQTHGYSALMLILLTSLHTHILMTYIDIPVEHFVKEKQQ